MEREKLEFDVLFVGAGPANLAGAIHLKKLAQQKGRQIEVCLIEKAESIGAHSLSGAVLDPKALKELMPDYLEKGCPIEATDLRDGFFYLTASGQFKLPYTPRYMHNEGCCIISLSKLCAWLGTVAEELGINVFPGFAGTEALYDESGKRVIGVRTGDKGLNKDGKPKSTFEPGVDLLAKVTVFGEGPQGSLLREVAQKIGIFAGKMPQVFETAVKEVIEIPPESPFLNSPDSVLHTFGYPLGLNTKGGGFVYRMKENRVSLGLVVGMDYEDPMLEPYQEFLRFKKHPLIADISGRPLHDAATGRGRSPIRWRQRLDAERPAAEGHPHRHEVRDACGRSHPVGNREKRLRRGNPAGIRAQGGCELDQNRALRSPQFRPGALPERPGQVHHRGGAVCQRRPGLRGSAQDRR
jgi:electron-transferring-flavoprotein dehydrogenase